MSSAWCVVRTPAPAAFNSVTFVYACPERSRRDGDGRRVKSTINGVTTTFIGNYYEVGGGTITKYYYAGTQRIAMRTDGTLSYLLGDHLGSTSLVTDSAGNKINEQRYKAWGETRYTFGNEKTRYQYTGQFSYTSDFGLHYYNARWYDSSLGRFAQPDTIIPQSQGVQAWDRFAYTNNNPVRYNDPTGHCAMLCTAALGALIGGVVNYGIQTYDNMSTKGMNFSEAVSWSNIDKKSLTVAIVGGAVAGLTMGAASTLTTGLFADTLAGSATAFAVENVAAGAAANVLAGQTEAIVSQVASERCLFCWEYNDNIISDAKEDGLLDMEVIEHDARAGAVWGTLGGLNRSVFVDVPHAAPPTPWIRGAATLGDTFIEYMNQDSKKHQLLEKFRQI